MNRSDIIDKIADLYPKLNKKQVDTIVKELFIYLSDNVASGNRVEIRGFGCFSLKTRSAGKVRNPREGISVDSAARSVVYFRPGKELRDRVDAINR